MTAAKYKQQGYGCGCVFGGNKKSKYLLFLFEIVYINDKSYLIVNITKKCSRFFSFHLADNLTANTTVSYTMYSYM